MADKPLTPFSPPEFLQNLPGGVPTAHTFIVWLFYLAVIIWTVYTLIAIYHWFKYSHAAAMAIPAIALHLFVSFTLVTFALTGVLFP